MPKDKRLTKKELKKVIISSNTKECRMMLPEYIVVNFCNTAYNRDTYLKYVHETHDNTLWRKFSDTTDTPEELYDIFTDIINEERKGLQFLDALRISSEKRKVYNEICFYRYINDCIKKIVKKEPILLDSTTWDFSIEHPFYVWFKSTYDSK